MNKEEYLKKLDEAFHDFNFFESDHHYEYKGERVGISVTRFIEEFANEFDSELIASRVAKKQGKTVEEVLDEWKVKNEVACEKGSLGHKYVQNKWQGIITLEELESCSEAVKKPLELILKQADNFYNDFSDKLEHLADEYVIGSSEYNIASAVDHLFVDKKTGGLILVDYKTNSDIHKSERYAKPMKAPLGHLKDCAISHYYIQLSLYKYFIEEYAKLEIQDMFIVYMSENIDNYEIIKMPYLKDEVVEILERRYWGLWKKKQKQLKKKKWIYFKK